MTRSLSWRTLEPTHDVVRAYLKQHPVPPEVLQKLERDVLGPTADYSINYRDGWNPTRLRKNRLKLAGFMEHWRNPASAKRRIGHRGWRKYDPQSVMAVLLAATVFAEERDWRQGQAAEMFRALHLLKMKRLPGYTSFPKSGKARRQTVIMPGLIRRLLAQVINERLGVYLLTTAREVIAWGKVPRPAKKRRPQKKTMVAASPPAPQPTVMPWIQYNNGPDPRVFAVQPEPMRRGDIIKTPILNERGQVVAWRKVRP